VGGRERQRDWEGVIDRETGRQGKTERLRGKGRQRDWEAGKGRETRKQRKTERLGGTQRQRERVVGNIKGLGGRERQRD